MRLDRSILCALCVLCGCTLPAETVFRRPLERVVSMDPLRASSAYDSRAVQLVYEPLLDVDYYARPYRLAPGLCDLPAVSSNGLVYTFTIRDGARFADDACFPGGKGRPVTAADIVYSLTRLGDPKNASSGMWVVEGLAQSEAVDARTVRFTLKKPIHHFPWLMSMTYCGVVPREAVERYGAGFGQIAVGSGPYRLESWWRNHRMVFARNLSWRGWPETDAAFAARFPACAAAAPYDKVEYLVVDDVSTQWLMFLSGEVEFLGEVSRDNWDAVVGPDGHLAGGLEEKGVLLHGIPTLEVAYVGFNMDDPVVGSNRKLRQALNCAFDFAAWKKFFNNRIDPCDGPVPHGVEGRLETPFAFAYNVEKAKALLVEAGYPGGIDPKTGKRLVLSICLGRATQDIRESTELMQAFLDRVGVSLEPRYMTWDSYLKTLNDRQAQLFRIAWVGDYPDAENFLQLFYSKNVSPGPNHTNYANPAFDRAYEEAMAAITDAARDAAWARAQEIVREDCPWIFLNFQKAYSLCWNRVLGYIPSDFPYGMEKHLRTEAR